MSSLNKVMLIGRLGKDPEIQNFESGAVKASFPLATSETYKDKSGQKVENTDWHNIVMWRGLAGIAEKYLVKGSLVYIEGKIRTRSWEDSDGKKRYITEVEAREMTMLGSRSDNPSSQSKPQVTANQPNTQNHGNSGTNMSDESLDDDLPF